MKLQRFIRETSGSVLTLTGLALAFLLAVTAIAVDMGYAYMIKARLQGTADIAAIAGAVELSGEEEQTDEDKIKASAQASAVLNMPSESHDEVLSEDDVTLGNWNGADRVFTPDKPRSAASPCVVDEYTAHCGCGHRKKMCATFPFDGRVSDETDVRFMDKRSRLQDVVGGLIMQVSIS